MMATDTLIAANCICCGGAGSGSVPPEIPVIVITCGGKTWHIPVAMEVEVFDVASTSFAYNMDSFEGVVSPIDNSDPTTWSGTSGNHVGFTSCPPNQLFLAAGPCGPPSPCELLLFEVTFSCSGGGVLTASLSIAGGVIFSSNATIVVPDPSLGDRETFEIVFTGIVGVTPPCGGGIDYGTFSAIVRFRP